MRAADDDPKVKAAILEVERTFALWAKARNRVNRCTREDSLERARAEADDAERAYRVAAGARDRVVADWRARHGGSR